MTGGAGFIGANLCRELASRPSVGKVVALDDLSTGEAAHLTGTDAKLVVGSILDRDLLEDVVAAADAVVHLAARPSVPRSLADPFASHEVNATGTMRVLEACRHRHTHWSPRRRPPCTARSPICPSTRDCRPVRAAPTASKLATESYVLAYGPAFGLPALVFRFFNVYGPLQPAGHAYAAVVPSFIDAALRGEPLTVFGDGHQTRDFTYVGTVARVLADAVERKVTNASPVNLAFGTRVSVLELAHRLAKTMELTVEIRHEAPRRGDVRDSQADDGLLRSLFTGLNAVPLEQGLAETVRWFHSLSAYA